MKFVSKDKNNTIIQLYNYAKVSKSIQPSQQLYRGINT